MKNLRPKYGIVGGLGPYASARFLTSTYSQPNIGKTEQTLPNINLISDPTIPDRSEALQKGDTEEVQMRLDEALENLYELKVDKAIILCFTAHAFLSDVQKSNPRFINLVEYALNKFCENSTGTYLLLCTTGTRLSKVYEKSTTWNKVKQKLILPDDMEQTLIHQLIYELKSNKNPNEIYSKISRIADKYNAGIFYGCTDLHLLSNRRSSDNNSSFSIFDPLQFLSADIANGTL